MNVHQEPKLLESIYLSSDTLPLYYIKESLHL